jgi:CheY-like chemotaxis protein
MFDLAEAVDPVSPETPGAVVYDRFQANADLLSVAVVDASGVPLGLIERNAFALLMAGEYGRALYASRAVSLVMDAANPGMADGDPAATREQAQLEGQSGIVRVLIADDNATNRMVAETLCRMFDCACESVENGALAVERARDGGFDLILMDIKMPVMDGLEALRQIRRLPPPIGGIPIIALTANADPFDAESYLARGMDAVVEKPIKPDLLLAAMSRLLTPEAEDVAA